MPDDPYSLSDLARLADVTPRTVRYYVAQGLLPSPEAAGSSTRYGEGHLARLRIIKRLQRDHLPLAEIRARLERMGDEEVLAAAEALGAPEPEPSQDPAETLEFVRSLMRQAGVTPAVAEPRSDRPLALHMAMAARDMPMPAPAAPAASGPMPAHRTQPDRTTWERLAITPDVELHVRRPLDRRSNKRVDQLERIARELFEEEP